MRPTSQDDLHHQVRMVGWLEKWRALYVMLARFLQAQEGVTQAEIHMDGVVPGLLAEILGESRDNSTEM